MVKYSIKRDNKGLTLIEIIVTMAVSSIIFTLILGVFITGIKLNGDIHNSIEIQQQGHFIMDFMTNRIMESRKVESISNYQRVSFYDGTEKIRVGVVQFKDNSLYENQNHIFSIQKDPKIEGRSIRYGKISEAKTELGNYLEAVYMSPLPIGHSFEESKGVQISIEMKKGKSTILISKNIYFRRN